MDDEEAFAVRVLKEAASRGETFVIESESGQYMARIHSDAMRSILSRVGGKPKQLTDEEAREIVLRFGFSEGDLDEMIDFEIHALAEKIVRQEKEANRG